MSWTDELSPAAVAALAGFGWHPGRSVDVTAWEDEITGDGFVVSEVARGLWRSLGGLEIVGVAGAALEVDPTEVQGYHDAPLVAWPAELGQRLCPVGVFDVVHSIFVGERGLMLTCIGSHERRRLADTPAAAVERLLFGPFP
jgi:hypothetical protein